MKHPKNISEHKIKMKQLSQELEGNLKLVAFEADVTISTVMRVLRCDYVNLDVIKAAIKVRNRLAKEKQSILSQI